MTAPRPALDLTCEELYSVAELQPEFDVTLSVKQDESTPPIGIQDAAWLQAGVRRHRGERGQGLSQVESPQH